VNGKRMPRWPLYLIAAPAAVAVWSGWVGLGQLCGFGVIHPLPGIWDAARLNTAITLPIGVEAYGAYALGAWLTPGASERARRFAKWSAVGALLLGMLGQVAYHLLTAAHAARAPWPVVTLVSCLPVVALALGTGLAHLLRESAEDMPDAVTIPARDDTAGTVAEDVSGGVVEPVPGGVHADVSAGVPVDAPAAVPVVGVPPVPVPRARAVSDGRAPKRARTRKPAAAETVFAAEIRAGTVPSLRSIKTRMNVGTDRARAILADLQGMSAQPDGVMADA
jgi:hypothetical protein